jgi:hypothetical protein
MMLLRFTEIVNRSAAGRADMALRVFPMKIRQRISLQHLKNPIEPTLVVNCLYSHTQMLREDNIQRDEAQHSVAAARVVLAAYPLT